MGTEEENSPGSEEVVEETIDQTSQEETSEEGGLHPAWSELMGALPSSLHSTVTPFLVDRDKKYQDGISKVHSQYADYKPLVENQIPVDRINYALQIAQAVEERPQDMIKALQEYTGMSKAEATAVVKEATEEPGQVESEIPDELFNHPKFQEMQQMVQTVSQYLVSQRQTEQQAQEDQKLAEELDTLRESKGDFNENWVLSLAMANPQMTLEQCVDAYSAEVTRIREESRKPAPKVLGQGGGTVDSQITPDNLKNPKDRKALIAQMLSANNQT